MRRFDSWRVWNDSFLDHYLLLNNRLNKLLNKYLRPHPGCLGVPIKWWNDGLQASVFSHVHGFKIYGCTFFKKKEKTDSRPIHSKLCRIKRFCPENVFVIGPAIFDTFENHCIVQLVSVADGELLLMRIIDIEVNITAEVTVEIYSNIYSKGSIMTNENIYKWLNIFYSTTFKTGRESLWI